MSTNQDLIDLLDSILSQVPSDFNVSRSVRKPNQNTSTTTNESFDKVRTLDILINNVLTTYTNVNSLTKQGQVTLVKVFKTLQYLIQQSYVSLIDNVSLQFDKVINKLLPFLNYCRYDGEVLKEVKLTLIAIVDVVCGKYHDFKTIKKLSSLVLSILDANTTRNFQSIQSQLDLGQLSISVHFLQFLQTYSVTQQLCLEQWNFQIDSAVRRIWLCLSHYVTLGIEIAVMDELSSVLLVSMSYTYLSDIVPSSLKLGFLTVKLNELINWNLLIKLPILQSNIAKVLLQLLLNCMVLQNEFSLSQSIRLRSCQLLELWKLNENFEQSIDKNLIKSLCILCFVLNKLNVIPSQDPDSTMELVERKFEDSLVAHAMTPMSDQDLETLRLQILCMKDTSDRGEFKIGSLIPLTDDTKLIELDIHQIDDLSIFCNHVEQLLKTSAVSSLGKLYIINALGTVLCLNSGDMDPLSKLCCRCDLQLNDNSYINNVIDSNRKPALLDTIILSVLQILWNLLSKEQEPVLIIAGLLALRKVFASYQPPKLVLNDTYYKFLSSCLVHDVREIRMLLSKILPYYLILEDDDIYQSNFQLIITCLQQIKINKNLHLAESTVVSWGELAIVIGIDEKLILVLVKLIDFIGSENQFQSTIAFHQLKIVSSCKRKTPWQLLSPFLPHLSVIIVKQMKSKPMIINKICGLVRVPIDVFLSRTQLYTIPHLLTYYKHDLIGEISSIIKVSKYELIKSNFPKIIAYLLTSEDQINELKYLQILLNVNDEFKNQSLHDLIENNILTSWEILKIFSPELQNETRIKNALCFVASMYSTEETTNQDKILHNYLKRTILGIVQNFSESTYDLKGLQPYIEKLRSIWAIDCLIQICEESIVAALPQITACLQLNLEIKHLHSETLYCLSVLTEKLDRQTMIVMLDFILSLILQKWDQFNDRCKRQCKVILTYVMKNNESIFKQRYYHYFFSFSFNPELLEIYNEARLLFPSSLKSSSYNLLHDLTIRCTHDNKFVVLQALDDLIHYFTKYQDEFHHSYVNLPTFIRYIPKLSATLLNISYKFKNSDANILAKCSVIFGLMGSLDFNRFYYSSIEEDYEQLVIINQFQDQNEVYRFLIQFINNTLVPLFWASIDPVKQLFLAYAIQEYLKLLGLNGVDISIQEKNSTTFIIWNKFSRISQSTLLPLLNSKYIVNGSKDESATYPIYKNHIKHSTWLREFTLDLLKKSRRVIGLNKSAGKIFNICSSIIKDQDLAICNQILPYAALNCVLVDEIITVEIEREILTILKTDVDHLNDNSSIDSLKSCYQSIFSILDYFRKWISARKQKRKRQDSSLKINEMTLRIELFLERIPQNLIAKRSSQCKSYERAILNLEESLRSSTIDKREFFSTIQSMYVEIDDLDSLNGVLKTFSTQSFNDKLLQFQYSDDWKIAQDCFDALSEFDIENQSLVNTTSLLKSLNKFNLYENCLEKLDHNLVSLSKDNDPIPLEWINLGLNSAVFTGRVNEINKWIYHFESNIESSSLNDLKILVNYEVAKSLISLNQSQFDVATKHVDNAIKLLGDSLAASKETSLSKTRDIMGQLHWLTDAKQLIEASTETKFNSAIYTLDVRLANTFKDFQSNWQILTIRRALDKLHPSEFSKKDISNVWMKLATIARQSSRLDLSTKLIMNALVLQTNSKEIDLEYAQLLWAQDDHSRALKLIDELRLKNIDGIALNREAARIQLKYSEWLDLSDSGSSELIIEEYTAAAKLDTKWEKPYYYLGKYYNKILENQTLLNNDIKTAKDYYGDYERGLVFNYLRAIKTGHTYLFEALPKIITIWLDYSSHYDEVPKGFKSDDIAMKRRKNYDLMKQCVKDVIDSTPKVYWYTVLSQLTSRMIHENTEIQKIIVDLIAKITYEYPQQALWSVIAQSKSTMKQRASLGTTILNIVAGYDKSNQLLQSAMALFDLLLKVCMQEVHKKTSEMHLKDDFGFDHRITPCDSLVVPLRENFEIKLPSSGDTSKKYSNYSIGSKITIHKIDDRVKILSSMQKPRRLAIRGSDGGIYNILCKPHDDLRKDAKLMEVTTMIDKLLQKDEESELRKLGIATYAVVPLNETYGIIEWVDRCRTMRDIILTYLASTGNPIDFSFCKKQLSEDRSLDEKIEGFNNVLKKYPPVFRLWFLEEFPDPKIWYTARNNFTRSSAVMSIVGHILGLGDRHGDNILMMERTGGVLHVDFDCLFDKGATLVVPERVPFRLTSNMVDAFGISGVDGIFRKSCEVTMELIRNNETGLMNILESFLYDPIIDWSVSKRRKRDNNNHNPEVVLNNIKKKIRGIEKDTSLSLSVTANVDLLITQATSVENLARMYIGWMSFL